MFGHSYKTQYIGGQKETFTRLDDLDSTLSMSSDRGAIKRCGFDLGVPFAGHGKKNKSFGFGISIGSKELSAFAESLKSSIAKTVIPQYLQVHDKIIFDPQDRSILFWNRLFVISCIFAVSIDPLFFYLPIFDVHCLRLDGNLAATITTLRTIIDCFYFIRIAFQFRTAYIAPSSRVFGRGELVVDPTLIARRYLGRFFIVDVLSVLPIPQIVVWSYLNQDGAKVLSTKTALQDIVLIQYVPRFIRFLPLNSELKKTAGVFAESALAGAAYYLLWYLLASHIVGALWYLLAVERNGNCWQAACEESGKCNKDFLYCSNEDMKGYDEWKRISDGVLQKKCNANDDDNKEFNFGIYTQAIASGIQKTDKKFSTKFLYSLWYGLKNLSTLGQGMQTSTDPGEIFVSIAVGISGLVLLGLLIGNMQTYLQSLTVRLEEMRIKRRDSEQWMHYRWLPQDLRERVRRYDHFKWLETRGVDEESLVQSLPKDLRRDIKRHLCLNLVRRVPLFANMDERLLDAICERLKPSLFTEGTCVVREGDPVDEMLLIIHGSLESVTTDGGRTGFFNRGLLKEGDFCGEELLTWALDPKSASNLPSSTRTVRALAEVEAFSLKADELKFVATQFRRLHSRQVQHTFRYYSQQWRTWAACFIQATYRRRKARRQAAEQRLRDEEIFDYSPEVEEEPFLDEELASADSPDASSRMRATVFASRFAANALRGHRRRTSIVASPPSRLINLQKPSEPDFSDE